MCGGCGWNVGVYDSWCADTLRGHGNAANLAAALSKSNVAVLDLDMAGLNAAAATTLAAALRGNRSVTSINMGWNAVGDEGAAALADALPGAAVGSIDLRGVHHTQTRPPPGSRSNCPHLLAAFGSSARLLSGSARLAQRTRSGPMGRRHC